MGSVDSSALQNASDLLKAQDYKAAERAYKKLLDSIELMVCRKY
jgi:hypothetical protein